jgi:dienelactone hydrolase
MKYIKTFAAFSVLLCFIQAVAQESMLCQGSYWTEDEANLKMKEFAATWHDRASWEKRASVIRQGIIDGMQLEKMPERGKEFHPMIHSTRKMNGYIVENIAIESFPGFYITGNLYRPVEEEGRHAAILCPHGHGQDARLHEAVQLRSAMLARMGAVVFAYDMVGYGDCLQVNHKMPIALLLQTYNSIRVLDYLVSRPDVDPERIGITGASGGGTQTFILTAIEDRITASAPVVQVSAHFFGGCVCESGMPIHRSARHQTNNVEIAALCAPRPLLIVSDGGDWTRNTPRIEYPYIQKVYALYDAEHRAENVHLPGERHDYGYSKRTAVYNFFQHHLGLSPRIPYIDGYIEDFISILPVGELRVFNEDYPLPAKALQGDKEVMAALGFGD